MPTLPFIHCDVFTTQPFGGNPLAVFPEAPSLETDEMQAIARELNLSETVFVRPPDDPGQALRRLRIFTPGTELPIAGHPVIGAWWVLAEMGLVVPPAGGSGQVTIKQQVGVGILPVSVEFQSGRPARVIMTQPPPSVGNSLALRDDLAEALGLGSQDLPTDRLPIVVASAGVPILLVALRDNAALKRAQPRQPALNTLLEKAGSMCAYLATWESLERIHARMFGGSQLGIVEDPATGSAAGPLVGALLHLGILPGSSRVQIDQGEDMGRPSRIEVEVDGQPGDVKSVRIAGTAVTLIRAELTW
jgi:trans-2,3-dihydro-3-hydroxyanthranilate isomerase